MTRAQDKVAVVTGGAAGLGAAIVRRLVVEGANVIATDTRAAAGHRLADELGCEFIEHDVTDEAQWQRVISEVETLHGALHILVNGVGVEGPFEPMNLETMRLCDWQAVHRAHVEGVFLGCRAAIPALRRSGGGTIINLSPTTGLSPTPELIAHGASQAAVLYLTKSIALYCAKAASAIRCNSVHPAIVMTSWMEQVGAARARECYATIEQATQELKSQLPRHEFQAWDDVADAVLFLVSGDAKHITGQALVVDGGRSPSRGGAIGTISERLGDDFGFMPKLVLRQAGWMS